jgi:hypothetical protein
MASQRGCTCVLITCMSQAAHGLWPGSDDTARCRQNGVKCSYLAIPGTADRLVTRANQPRARPSSGACCGRRGPRARPTIRAGDATARCRQPAPDHASPRDTEPRSLLEPDIRPEHGERVAADRAPARGRPPPARRRQADDPNHFLAGRPHSGHQTRKCLARQECERVKRESAFRKPDSAEESAPR